MCGICGVLSLVPGQSPDRRAVEGMVRRLAHRGPDEQAVKVQGPLAAGHARLSIIDLAGGRQPLENEDGSVVLVANGEIYNFRKLRQELTAAGHRFATGSDCEVIVHLWEEEGPRCVERLRGMFALVLYDRRRQVLFAARDRFGQKPFYYHAGQELFAFASEVKALAALPQVPRTLDKRALDQFLFYQYVPEPRTMFADVRQLPPAHTLTVEQGRVTLTRYWQPEFQPGAATRDEEHIEHIEAALLDSVTCHLESDVPLGVALSGGIDSSLMLALATRASGQRLQTFSIGFPGNRSDESRYAEMAARHFGAEHHAFAFQPANLRQALDTLGGILCQPLADSAILPLWYLSQNAVRHVKVVLTGDGGDELFGGYRKYRRANLLGSLTGWVPRLCSIPRLAATAPDPWRLRRLQSRLAMAVCPLQRSLYCRRFWEGWDRHALYQPELLDELAGPFVPRSDPFDATDGSLNRVLRIDQAHYLADDLLLKTDLATMACGLEARAPLLDHLVAAAAGRLPPHLKATPQQTKVALRQLAARHLPPKLVQRRKQGFNIPIKQWFRGELALWCRACLVDESTTVGRYFRPEVVGRLLDEHVRGHRDHSSRIYALLAFELWHRHHYLGAASTAARPLAA